MKLLFDHHLSPTLVDALADLREIEELIRSRYPLIASLPDAAERGILVLFRKRSV